VKLNEQQVEELRRWSAVICVTRSIRRPVVLEIVAVGGNGYGFRVERVVARVYLREPRCYGHGTKHDAVCECGPIAERRLA
jgi:hypothetical protein